MAKHDFTHANKCWKCPAPRIGTDPDEECPNGATQLTVKFQHDWAVMLSGKQICNVCKLEHVCTSFLNYPKCAVCTEDCPQLFVRDPVRSTVGSSYWMRAGIKDDTCQCPKPVHIRWNGLGWFCDACGKKSSDNSTSYSSPTLTSSCDCGSDAVYGPGNNMHSATMPCSAYKKP